MKRYRLRILLGAVAAAVAIALMIIMTNGQGSAPTFTGQDGPLEKNEVVGVTTPSGGRIDTVYRQPKGKLETSPLAGAFEVIHPPVDITPVKKPAGTTVSFRVPSRVPLEAKDSHGKLQRSIYNAAIEVYEPSMDVWVPLDTRVDGDVLTAVAPHFSIYQAVWLKMGEQKVGDITVTTTPEMSPTDILWRTGLEYLKQFAFNAIGKFDESKFDCKKRDEGFKVTLANPSKTDDFDVCVVQKDEGHSTILVKNGWAVPLRLTTSAGGVTADTRPADIDLVTLVRNHMGKAFTGSAYASGLDVGSFTIDHEVAPDKITVKAEVSWAGTALDVTLAMLTAIFPASRLAEKAGPLIDLGNCLAMAAQKNVMGTPGTDVPAKLMETAKSCMVPFVVDELHLGSFLGALAKEARILPELAQMGKIAAMQQITGVDPTATSAVIERTDGFDELQGPWIYRCAGSDDLLLVKGNKVDWMVKSFTGDSGSVETTTFAKGTLYQRDGKPVLILDETDIDGLKAGMAANVEYSNGANGPSFILEFSQQTQYLYVKNEEGPSYC